MNITLDKPEFCCNINERLPYQIRSMLNAPGLYRILNIINNKFYLGIAVNLSTRFRSHINHLNLGSHDNQLLQDDWKEFGDNAFKFEVIKFAKTEDEYDQLLEIESKTLIELRKNNVPIYNLSIAKFTVIKRNQLARLLNKKSSEERFSKNWIIIYPDGREEYITNLRDFCRERQMDHKCLAETADGIRNVYRGFKCRRGSGNVKKEYKPRHHLRGEATPSSRKYIVIFPDGHEEIIIGLAEFARSHDLNYRMLWATVKRHGTRSNHKGYKVKEIVHE